MSITSIASKIACSGANAANTGKKGCLSLFGEPSHMLAYAKGTVILGSGDFDIATLKPLIQKGTVIPLIDATAFEDVSGEDQYSTSSGGVKRLNLKGLPEYKLMFEEGHEFYREIAKLEGYKQFDFVIGDDEGNWMLPVKSDGNFKGFTAGHVTPELTKRKVSGGDSESKSILVQFTNRLEWDENYEILHIDELTMTPQEIPTVNGCVLTYEAAGVAVPPSNTDTTLKVSVKLASDNDTWVTGLLAANFIVKVNGSSAAITDPIVEDTDGNYTLTIPAIATGEVIITDVWDNTLNVDVTDLAGVLYRGEEVNATVIV